MCNRGWQLALSCQLGLVLRHGVGTELRARIAPAHDKNLLTSDTARECLVRATCAA